MTAPGGDQDSSEKGVTNQFKDWSRLHYISKFAPQRGAGVWSVLEKQGKTADITESLNAEAFSKFCYKYINPF